MIIYKQKMYSRKVKQKITNIKSRKSRKSRKTIKKQKGGMEETNNSNILIQLNDENIHEACEMWCDSDLRTQCEYLYGPISQWNVSEIKDMQDLFYDQREFNADISGWDTSKVTNMGGMFYGNLAFNQPLDSWDVSKVTAMDGMFADAQLFNQPLNSWDVRNVGEMQNMFQGALSFNQPLDNWEVGNVSEMARMFEYAINFNQDLSIWNITKNLNLTITSGEILDGYMFAGSEMSNNMDYTKYPSKLNTAMSLKEFKTCAKNDAGERICGITLEPLYRKSTVQPPNETGNKSCYDRDAFIEWYKTNPSHPETRSRLDKPEYSSWVENNLNEMYGNNRRNNIVLDPEDDDPNDDIEDYYSDLDEYDEIGNNNQSYEEWLDEHTRSVGGNKKKKYVKKRKGKQKTTRKISNKNSKRKTKTKKEKNKRKTSK